MFNKCYLKLMHWRYQLYAHAAYVCEFRSLCVRFYFLFYYFNNFDLTLTPYLPNYGVISPEPPINRIEFQRRSYYTNFNKNHLNYCHIINKFVWICNIRYIETKRSGCLYDRAASNFTRSGLVLTFDWLSACSWISFVMCIIIFCHEYIAHIPVHGQKVN